MTLPAYTTQVTHNTPVFFLIPVTLPSGKKIIVNISESSDSYHIPSLFLNAKMSGNSITTDIKIRREQSRYVYNITLNTTDIPSENYQMFVTHVLALSILNSPTNNEEINDAFIQINEKNNIFPFNHQSIVNALIYVIKTFDINPEVRKKMVLILSKIAISRQLSMPVFNTIADAVITSLRAEDPITKQNMLCVLYNLLIREDFNPNPNHKNVIARIYKAISNPNISVEVNLKLIEILSTIFSINPSYTIDSYDKSIQYLLIQIYRTDINPVLKPRLAEVILSIVNNKLLDPSFFVTAINRLTCSFNGFFQIDAFGQYFIDAITTIVNSPDLPPSGHEQLVQDLCLAIEKTDNELFRKNLTVALSALINRQDLNPSQHLNISIILNEKLHTLKNYSCSEELVKIVVALANKANLAPSAHNTVTHSLQYIYENYGLILNYDVKLDTINAIISFTNRKDLHSSTHRWVIKMIASIIKFPGASNETKIQCIHAIIAFADRENLDQYIRDGILIIIYYVIDEIDYIDSAIKDSFTPIILRLLHNLNKDDLQMIEKKAMSFDINQTPFEEYYINLQKLLEPSSYFTLPEIDRKDISDEEWVQLKKRLLDIATNIFPNRTKEQKISFKNIFQRKRLAKFFDLIMETRDVKLFGLQKIRKRIAYIIDHIEKDAEAEKMKLLTILVEGGKACSDRCMQTIEEVELEMILNSLDPNDANQAIIELVVCRWKREKINEIVANIDRRDENIESGIYYSLLLNDRFGLNMNSQTMQFSVEANKALLPNLIEQFFDSTSSESFLTSMLYSPTFDQKVLKPLLDKEQETEGTELYKLAMDADEKYEEKKEQFKHIQALQAFQSAGYLEKRKNEANHKDKRRRIDEIVVK